MENTQFLLPSVIFLISFYSGATWISPEQGWGNGNLVIKCLVRPVKNTPILN